MTSNNFKADSWNTLQGRDEGAVFWISGCHASQSTSSRVKWV